MLDDLDSIDWSKLEDAYGPATPVRPFLLSESASDREETIFKLYMGICHQQCTVTEATVAAIPFLLELAAEVRVQDRDRILGLLDDIARAGANNATQGGQDLSCPGISLRNLLRR